MGEQEALHTIQSDITNNEVFLYMKGTPEAPMCGFSAQVVQVLKAHGIRYGSRNVLEDWDIREGIKKFANWPTIPQLYINKELVGGSDIMMEMFESGELQPMVK